MSMNAGRKSEHVLQYASAARDVKIVKFDLRQISEELA
jgi:hypothetical protein